MALAGPDQHRPVIAALRLMVASVAGIFVFFVPVTLAGHRTIVLDHLVNGARHLLGSGSGVYALILIVAGAIEPWLTGSWRRSIADRVLAVLKVGGVVAGLLAWSGAGPAVLQAPNMLPFLFDKLVIPVGLIVPIGAVFLVLLVGYGLMEMLGVLLAPVMRPLWRTPGQSAIDAVASFVGSYSIGLLITDRVYRDGRYSAREAAIIATGFSTVSVPFMLIVAKTLGLMSVWNAYFWGTLLVTFGVTAITARIPPLSRMDDRKPKAEPDIGAGSRWRASWQAGQDAAARAPSLLSSVAVHTRDGLLMTIRILPSIMSVGLLGLLLAHYTPVFALLGWVFYPVAWLWGVAEPLALVQSVAAGLAEMFLPALLIGPADFVARLSTGVVSVSSILFFSASIPCIVSTQLPLSVPTLLVLWFERTLLSLLLAIPLAYGVASIG